MRWLLACVLLAVTVFAARSAHAHKPSDAHVIIMVRDAELDVRADVALRDLDWVLGLDRDGDGAITWGELRAERSAIGALVQRGVSISSEAGACTLSERALELVQHSDGAYAVVRLRGSCVRAPSTLNVDYSLLLGDDPLHRGLLRVEGFGDPKTEILSHDRRRVAFSPTAAASGFGPLLRSGVVHIFTGYDHLLFLFALLLPAVLRREGASWLPATARESLTGVVQIVTAFTVAHSITLALGAFSIVSPPSRLVESAIAASVVLAAVDNIFGFLRVDRWVVPFGLGLIHGFGFSSTLTDLGLRGQALGVALVGFNLGVELGQLACVAVFLPIAYAARRTGAYRRLGLQTGSIVIAVIATAWLVERAFAIPMPWSERG